MKWLQASAIIAGMSMGNFGWQYFSASPDYARAALESFHNALGIITYLIIVAL
jgi:hypothetical protein